jgi:hypothetical protein
VVWLTAGILIITAGLMGRAAGIVESLAFFAPSQARFVTPPGIDDLTIPGPGGATLHGWLLRAEPGTTAKGLILFCHGNAGALPDHLAFVHRFTALGYDVIMFDYRGYGRSSPLRRLTRDSLLADTDAALRFARESAADAPLFVLGHSMGAAMAANALARDPQGVAALGLVAPFSSFPRVASDFGGPFGWLLIPTGRSVERAAARLSGVPLIIVHGRRDAIVRVYHGRRVHDAALAAGVRSRLVISEDADHVTIFDDEHDGADALARFFADSSLQAELLPRPTE